MTDDHAGRKPDPSRARSLAVRLGTALFVVSAAVALLVTFGGARELVEQVTAAPDDKSGLIAVILSFGFVLLGPALLLALAMLTPRAWIPAAFAWVAHFQDDHRAHRREQHGSR